MLFVHPPDSSRAAAIVERQLKSAGARAVVWRDVPTDPAAVLPAQRATTPRVVQVAAVFDQTPATVDAALYRTRIRIERAAREQNVRLTIVSLSTRTVVYKALVTPDGLPAFYPDLSETRFQSSFITFHQRFSTPGDWRVGLW